MGGRHWLAISSVKTNNGHTEGGAGITGLIKCVYLLQKRMCQPMLHLRALTPYVEQQAEYFQTQQFTIEPYLLPKDTQPAIGVSAFGFSGTNAHAILIKVP